MATENPYEDAKFSVDELTRGIERMREVAQMSALSVSDLCHALRRYADLTDERFPEFPECRPKHRHRHRNTKHQKRRK